MSQSDETFAVRFAMVVALLLLAAALIALAVDPATFDQRQGQYEAAVIGTLLPLFGLVAAAIVGKEIARALKRPGVPGA